MTKLTNTGWQPIEDKDFFEPITVSFGEKAELMSHSIIDCKPKSLRVEATPQSNQITIKPLLLNRGDSFKVKALVDNYQSPVDVDARIKGVPQLDKFNPARRELVTNIASAVVGGALAAGALSLYFKFRSKANQKTYYLITGRVLDESTKKGIVGASVELSIANMTMGTSTDSEGRFRFSLPDEYSLFAGIISINALGYEVHESSFTRLPHNFPDIQMRKSK